MTISRKITGFAILTAVLATSCASLGRGQSEVDSMPLSENYKKFRASRRQLYIQNFDNRTYSPQLTGRLKEKLQYAFTRRPSLTVTPDKKNADLILYGKILLYVEEPGVADRSTTALSYNLSLVVSAKLRARSAAEVPAEVTSATDDRDVPEEQLTVRYMTAYNTGEPFFETRYTAEERMLEGIADRIVNSSYEPEVAK